jgi:hypothetical protein
VLTVIIAIAVIAYVGYHLGAGHTHHPHGLSPDFYWSSVHGPYASVRLPGGFRVGHRL